MPTLLPAAIELWMRVDVDSGQSNLKPDPV